MPEAGLSSTDWERPLTQDPGRSHTMPARCYLEPEIYRREIAEIFRKTWQHVGHLSQFRAAGDYVAGRIADQSVVVLRNKQGGLQGFHNVCRHRAHELLQGAGNIKNVIVCPYHAWTYDLDGALRSGPHLTQLAEFDRKEIRLQPIRVETLGPFVFANIDQHAPALAEIGGEMMADIEARFGALDDLEVRQSFDFGAAGGMAANWKVVADNFLECYHCEIAHPAFVDLVKMETYQVDAVGYWSRQLIGAVRAENSAYAVPEDAPRRTGGFWFLWPNTTINFLPGKEGAVVLKVQPLDVERAAFTGAVLAPPGMEDDSERINYVSDPLGVEDQLLCESVQRGLHSVSYDQGRFVVTDQLGGTEEHAVHHFHRLVKRVHEGAGAYPA